MQVIKPSIEIIDMDSYENILKKIEKIGRVCYKSEGKITEDSAEKFIRALLTRQHESVIEHESVTIRMICDRGVSHEIVRHRIASYSQESTRYCNYAGDKFDNQITVIDLASGKIRGLDKSDGGCRKGILPNAGIGCISPGGAVHASKFIEDGDRGYNESAFLEEFFQVACGFSCTSADAGSGRNGIRRISEKAAGLCFRSGDRVKASAGKGNYLAKCR